ncbi:MAG: hypothetical protein HYX90_06875, partial [Chloroflexi bacterium]|nr:hypothetical protein [Chloroflexota bacterium]
MELTQDEVIEILKLVEESSFDELELNMDGVKLVVRRAGKGTPAGEVEQATITPTNFSPAAASHPVAPEAVQKSKEAGIATACASLPPTTAAVVPLESGVVAIAAPTVGTFYRSPKPGAPPFVQEGSVVSE